jgi:hypothetical protein
MPKFDHRFDNHIQKKEDLRFTDIETAEEYAEHLYCQHPGEDQAILEEIGTPVFVVVPKDEIANMEGNFRLRKVINQEVND